MTVREQYNMTLSALRFAKHNALGYLPKLFSVPDWIYQAALNSIL